MPESPFATFEPNKYISLETFKKNGQGVQTPVWFAQHDGALYVYTEADSWKVKRIRNNPSVRVALCTVRGRVTGPWLNGTAAFVEGDERRRADDLLNKKYLLKVLFNWLTRINRHERAMIRIRPFG